MSKRATQEIDTERFNVKTLNERDVKEQYQVTIRNKFESLENLKRATATSTRHGTILERTLHFRPKTVKVIVNQRKVNCGLMRNVQKWLTKGSGLNYSGSRIQVQ
jgi:hypothetical protein